MEQWRRSFQIQSPPSPGGHFGDTRSGAVCVSPPEIERVCALLLKLSYNCRRKRKRRSRTNFGDVMPADQNKLGLYCVVREFCDLLPGLYPLLWCSSIMANARVLLQKRLWKISSTCRLFYITLEIYKIKRFYFFFKSTNFMQTTYHCKF